ncbi:MAG: hypothetical protein K2Q29_11820 [Sphingomonadales bacterium]|jgi:hypothetical protein|nr:hypothetical protein [Sphingomonadales bacterium]
MTRIAKPQEWTPFDDLLRQIARDRFLPVTADDLLSLQLSWKLIFDRLERNAWQTRTTDPASYRFTVTEPGCEPSTWNAIDLHEGNMIDRDFWDCFWDAQETGSPIATIPPKGKWADRRPDVNSFEFYHAHPGSALIAGAVRGVEVRICDGEMARLKPGRKPNSKTKEPLRDPVKFAALMDEVAAKIERGEGRKATVAWARREVKVRKIGKEHTETADKVAIYRELKARGL